MDVAARREDIPASARHSGRVDVGGMEFQRASQGCERCPDRSRSAAEVDNDGRRTAAVERLQEPYGLADEEFRAAAGHEDAGIDGDPQAAELCPAQDVLKREARNPPVQHGLEPLRRRGSFHEEECFFFCENAARCPEPGDDDHPCQRCFWHRRNGYHLLGCRWNSPCYRMRAAASRD